MCCSGSGESCLVRKRLSSPSPPWCTGQCRTNKPVVWNAARSGHSGHPSGGCGEPPPSQGSTGSREILNGGSGSCGDGMAACQLSNYEGREPDQCPRADGSGAQPRAFRGYRPRYGSRNRALLGAWPSRRWSLAACQVEMLNWVKALIIGPDETELHRDAAVLELAERCAESVTRPQHN